MRARWHDWVIAVALVTLSLGGIWALWGSDIVALFSDAPPPAAQPESPAK